MSPAKAAAAAQTVNGAPPARLVDLDALLADKLLHPVPVLLGGRTFALRRDLKTGEVNEFWAAITKTADLEAWTILLGSQDQAKLLLDVFDDMPNEHRVFATRTLLVEAKLRSWGEFDPSDPEDVDPSAGVAAGESEAS